LLGERLAHILERLFGRAGQPASVLLFEDESDSEPLPAGELGQWFVVGAPCPAECPVRAGHPRPPAHDCPRQQAETQSALCVPVQAGERVIGALCCESSSAGAFTEQDERLLATFAGQAAAALEGLRTARQRERLAVLEERDRVARALHDGLAQRFGYLGLTLDGLPPLLTAGRLDTVQEDLIRLRQAVDEGQAEIRTTIAGLRQTAAGRSLDAEMAALVRRWGREHQAAARFRCTVPRGQLAAPAQAEHLLGIVQEALTNIAKHAQATQVEVTVEPLGTENVLTIADDGVGFDPTQAQDDSAHFGLIIMEERAALLGGRLTINSARRSSANDVGRAGDSAPGPGTRITVVWPAGGSRGG
jgi:two-component system nitrate/nitrite sensor histidine kinase NarX